jgi:general secretion pathway protein F
VLLFKSGALVNVLRNTPGLKRWFSSGDTARWTSTLAVLVQNKVPILGALELTAKAASFPEVTRRIGFLQADVRNGVQLSASMENHRVLDATSLSMIKVGERSGELGTMLGYVANYWLDRNRNMQKRLVSLIEPFSILFLGLVIGVVMVGVIMAITSLTQVKL